MTPMSSSLRIPIEEVRRRAFGLILDVRTQEERERGYYPNSIPVELSTLREEVPFLQSNRAVHILVYANGDSRAEQAANTLYNMGYHNTRYIAESYIHLLPGSDAH
jgi:rhodanese-related sulfurtransferase